MGKLHVALALAAAFLLGTVVAAPGVNACGKVCAQATPAAVKKPTVKKSVRGYGDSVNAAGGNIDDYWSPCNSKYWPDYMYCQP